METSLSLDKALSSAAPFVSAGAALHWLRPFEKAPIQADWSKLPVPSVTALKDTHRVNANIGIRLGEPSKTDLGYVYLIDLDIRDESKVDAALSILSDMWPDYAQFPYVISGSGGSSRHFYFICDQLFRSRKLAKSDTFQMVWDDKKQRDVKKNDWEIELFGTGKQAVLPPSIHPDTKLPYVWGAPFEAEMIDLGVGPVVESSLIESWGAAIARNDSDDDEDDLFAIIAKSPLGLEDDEVTRIIKDLPEDWSDDRDQWLTVGAALHHEFGGSNDGFTRWCDWSQTSEKYDEKDQGRVWRSFKGAKHPVRMATLIQAAGQNRLTMMYDGVDDDDLGDLNSDDDDLDDLLGDETEVMKTDANWRSYLQITEDGGIKATLPNVQLIIANDPRTATIIAKNQFTQETVLISKPGEFKLKRPSPKPVRQLEGDIWEVRDKINGDLWSTSHDYPVRTFLEAPARQGGYGLKTSDRDLAAAVDMAAQTHAFHPVREYLNSVAWDGVQRVDGLFIDYLGCKDTDYHRTTARLTLLGAVARVFEPGHKFDFVPILEGAQGKRKSTFIRILGHQWSAELSGDFHDNKLMVEQMQGAWIMEIPELQGFSKTDTTILKAFVSKTSDKVRLAFERRAKVYPRQCIFVGSTNDQEYLRDTTGGRRFWPVKCDIREDIDTPKLSKNLDQLWAEAVVMYKELRAKTRGDLPLFIHGKEALKEAELLQDSRRVASVEEGLAGEIGEWLDTPVGVEFDDLDDTESKYRNAICVKEIWSEMMGKDTASLTQPSSLMIGRALRLVEGWNEGGRKPVTGYGRQRVFERE